MSAVNTSHTLTRRSFSCGHTLRGVTVIAPSGKIMPGSRPEQARNREEARQDLSAWLMKWSTRYPKLCSWVEENIDETLTF